MKVDHSKSVQSLKRSFKDQARDGLRRHNQALVDKTCDLLESVHGVRYPTVVIDPPWDWGDEGDHDQFGRGKPTYATMPIDQTAALPISELAAADAHLYLWITNRSLPKGFGLIERWGFRYVTQITWCKPSFGLGNYFRRSTEHILFAVRGSARIPEPMNSVGGVSFSAARPNPRRHSAKPTELYDLVEMMSPGPWIDVFAREQRQHWTCWGADAAPRERQATLDYEFSSNSHQPA
jgi:N6-adenosine-specific RNA methylase IME4